MKKETTIPLPPPKMAVWTHLLFWGNGSFVGVGVGQPWPWLWKAYLVWRLTCGGSQSSLEHSVPQLKPLFYFGRILSTLILGMTQQFGKTKKDDTVQPLRWAHYFTQLTFHSDLLFLASSWSSAGFVFFSGAAVSLNLSKWWCFLFCWDWSCVPDCTASKSTGDHVSSPGLVF